MARKKKLKIKFEGPEYGDYMVDIYNADGSEIVEQKNFPGGRGVWDFIDGLPPESMAKVYRYSGWQSTLTLGDWNKGID